MMNKKAIEALICKSCGKAFLSPVFTCDRCGSELFEKILIDGEGEILSFTEVFRAGPNEKTPYMLGVIELKGGARITTKIENFEEKEITIGKKVVATGRYHNDTPLFEIV